jgi:hypothetical protein
LYASLCISLKLKLYFFVMSFLLHFLKQVDVFVLKDATTVHSGLY